MCFLRLIEKRNALTRFQNAFRFAQGIMFLQIFAAIGFAFAANDRDARLHKSVRSIYLKRDNCQALLRFSIGELGDFFLCEEEAPCALGVGAFVWWPTR